MDLQLTGKRAIVTGGSRGIGLASARALAAEGCDVALVAREPTALGAAREAVAAESGRRVIAISADTGDEESVRSMVSAVAVELGGAEILVNAAEPGSPWRRSSGGSALLSASAGLSPPRRWRRS